MSKHNVDTNLNPMLEKYYFVLSKNKILTLFSILILLNNTLTDFSYAIFQNVS